MNTSKEYLDQFPDPSDVQQMRDEPMVYPHLTVLHNHGVLELADASEFRDSGGYRHVRGTIVGGGQTSRLFWATHYTPFPTGRPMTWCIGGHAIHEVSPGRWTVSAVFCG